MTATIKIELSLENLVEAIKSLNFQEKCQLKEIIESEVNQEFNQQDLLDQTLFILNEQDWQEFNQVLEQSPDQNEKLTNLLNSTPPW